MFACTGGAGALTCSAISGTVPDVEQRLHETDRATVVRIAAFASSPYCMGDDRRFRQNPTFTRIAAYPKCNIRYTEKLLPCGHAFLFFGAAGWPPCHGRDQAHRARASHARRWPRRVRKRRCRLGDLVRGIDVHNFWHG